MANNFVYSQPVKIFFGEGKFASLGDILAAARKAAALK